MSKSSLSNFIATRFDGVVISGHSIAVHLRREVVGATPLQIRAAVEGLSRLNPGWFGGALRYEKIAGVRCGIVSFQGQSSSEKRVIWIHGGAFAFGSARVYKATAVFLARELSCEIVIPEYRLSPEEVFPAAMDDIYDVYKEMQKNSSRENQSLFLVGDSAGGNLAACLTQRCLTNHTPVPSKLALLSPWMDLSKGSESNTLNQSSHSPFDNLDTVAFSRDYIGEMSDKDPQVSPVFGQFEGFPVTHVQGSLVEFLYSDAIVAVAKLEEAGVEVTTHWEPKALHGWHLLPDILPEANRSMTALANFFKG